MSTTVDDTNKGGGNAPDYALEAYQEEIAASVSAAEGVSTKNNSYQVKWNANLQSYSVLLSWTSWQKASCLHPFSLVVVCVVECVFVDIVETYSLHPLSLSSNTFCLSPF